MANEALQVEVQKDFQVPVEQLYQAWNDPQQLKQWWKPMGNSLQDVRNDLKEGGTVEYIFSDETIVISGQYEQVQPNQKLVYTWNWKLKEDTVRNADYKLTVEFRSAGDGSSLHILQQNFENEESMQPHREGWDKGLEDLKNFVEGQSSSASGQSSSASAQSGESVDSKGTAGYGETAEQQKVGGA